ncbi:MAG: DUF3000 domain-containing protein [Carbonactinosporaceae bacterium]
MEASRGVDRAAEEFQGVFAGLRAARLRREVIVEEVPAPARLAPYSAALSAEVVVGGQELASGRLVLLHNPAAPEAWCGTYRLVTFVRAELEPEMMSDPLLPSVGWTWLTDALGSRDARHVATSGTVTRAASESFGTLADRPATTEIEVRASWTPTDADLRAHLEAWVDLLCTAAGLPPLPPGVVAISQRRGTQTAR